MNQKINMIII